MILYIDTTDFSNVAFALSDGKKVYKKNYKIDPHKSHEILGLLEKFLLYHKIKLEEGTPLPINKIVVNKGPGSYTGVRVGVTHALTLGFAWGVKVSALGASDYTRIFARI
jgi:tRNA threonylcarbamoyladenosine biosynthesis protein TsaB